MEREAEFLHFLLAASTVLSVSSWILVGMMAIDYWVHHIPQHPQVIRGAWILFPELVALERALTMQGLSKLVGSQPHAPKRDLEMMVALLGSEH